MHLCICTSTTPLLSHLCLLYGAKYILACNTSFKCGYLKNSPSNVAAQHVFSLLECYECLFLQIIYLFRLVSPEFQQEIMNMKTKEFLNHVHWFQNILEGNIAEVGL